MPIPTMLKMDNGLTVFVEHTFINAPLDESEKRPVVRKYSIPSSFRFGQHELLEASLNLKSNSKLADVFSGSNPDPQVPLRSKQKATSRAKRQGNQKLEWEPSMRFQYDFARIIKRTMKLLESSDLIAHVQLSESSHEGVLSIQLSDQGSLHQKQVVAFAEKALLDCACPSKSIFILGFHSASPFVATAFGFDARFVAMENASTACWHLFKKGFCRHGNTCCKQHPSWTQPIRVLIVASPSDTQNKLADGGDMKSEM